MEESLSIEDQAFRDLQLIVIIRRKKESNKKVEEIKELLNEGANVNAKLGQFGGNTPLHFAVEVDDLDVLNFLLTVDSVDPNIENDRHETPLALAQRLQKSAIVQALSGHSVVTKQPIRLFEEDKHLLHLDGIHVLNTDLMIKLVKPSHQQIPVQLPNAYVLSRLALCASTIVNQAQLPPKGWTLLTAERSESGDSDYVGAAYWNADQQQIVVAHWCKCNATDVSNDKWDGFTFDDMIPFINSTISFSHKILNLMNDLNKSGLHFTLSFTGHSFGGWLAQIAALSVKYLIKNEGGVYVVNENTGYHAHTVVFDSPGCKEALLDIIARLNITLTKPLIALDITTYVSAPNRVNTCNTHIGILYRIFIDLSFSEQKSIKYNLATHSMNHIAQCFDHNTGQVKLDDSGQLKIQVVVEWPTLRAGSEITHYKTFYKSVTKLNNYHERPITCTFDFIGRYRTCEFNPTEFEMRLQCQAHLQSSEERSLMFEEYYKTLNREYFKAIKQNPIPFEISPGSLEEILMSEKRILLATHIVPTDGVLIIYKHLQRLTKDSELIYKNMDCFYLALRQVLSFESDLRFLKFLSETDPKLLILECQSAAEVKLHLKIDYNSLLDALPNSKIVLVSDEECKLHIDGTTVEILRWYWLSALGESSQQKTIKNARIDFQGKQVTWRNVLKYEPWSQFIDFDQFIESCSQNGLKFGNELPLFHGIYIQRTLTLLNLEFIIDTNCFKNSKVDIFAISNMSIDELKPLVSEKETICLYQSFSDNQGCRFIILENNDAHNQFRKLSDTQWQTNNVHWLHKVKFVKDFDNYNKCDEIIWRNTTGSFNELQFEEDNAVGKAAECQKTEGWGSSVTANDINDPFVVITGIEGMGKSTLLAQLAMQIKETDPSLLVVPIDLSTWAPIATLEFESREWIGDKEHSIRFMIDVLDLKSDLEIKLFRHYLRKSVFESSKVVVLLDGFDEIAAKQKRIVIRLVKTLISMKIKQIWLSCRPISIREWVIDKISNVAYILDELTTNQQKRLMSLYCFGQSDDKLNELNNLILKLNKHLFVTPLHVKMLAELGSQTISDEKCVTNIANIYELYVTSKVEEVHGEKHHSMVKMYQSMALMVLFPDDYEWLLSDWTRKRILEWINSIEKGYQQSALLSGIVNGVPRFVHRTMAEYLAAHWFMDILSGDNENAVDDVSIPEFNNVYEELSILSQDVKSLWLKRIFEFFVEDVLNGEYSFLSHVCKLNYLNESFISRLQVFVDNVRLQQLTANDEDCELLHFAAKHGQSNIVKRLIKGGADLTLKHYFQHTPLYYAVQNQDEKVVYTILETVRKYPLLKCFGNIPRIIEDNLLHLAAYFNNAPIASGLLNIFKTTMINSVNGIHDTPLHVASNLASERVLRSLIREGAEINSKNVYNHTPLYLACEQGHLDIVKDLVRAGADINITPSSLHCAVSKGHLQVVKFLLCNRPNINLKDENIDHNTPLHLAVENHNIYIVMDLLSYDSVDVNVANIKNITPSMLAKSCNNRQIEGLFEVHLSGNLNIKDEDELKQARDNLMQKLNLGLPHGMRRDMRERAVEKFLKTHRDKNYDQC